MTDPYAELREKLAQDPPLLIGSKDCAAIKALLTELDKWRTALAPYGISTPDEAAAQLKQAHKMVDDMKAELDELRGEIKRLRGEE